jgi:hypothetical protein
MASQIVDDAAEWIEDELIDNNNDNDHNWYQ